MQIGQDKVVKVLMGNNVLYEPPVWKSFTFKDYKGSNQGMYAYIDGVMVFKNQIITLRSRFANDVGSSPTLFCQLPDEFTNYKVVATPIGGFPVSGGDSYYGHMVSSVDGNSLYADFELSNGASGYSTTLNLAGLQISCERK